jgi:hypothetical protein
MPTCIWFLSVSHCPYHCEPLEHICIVLYRLILFEFHSACAVINCKSLECTMAEKFMTGALYEACYVV